MSKKQQITRAGVRAAMHAQAKQAGKHTGTPRKSAASALFGKGRK